MEMDAYIWLWIFWSFALCISQEPYNQKTYSPARPLVSGAGGDKTLILCTFVILYRIAPT